MSEIPTEFMSNGVIPGANGFTKEQFQEFLFRETLRRRELYLKMVRASSANRKVLLCDRGLLDIIAYTNLDLFNSLLRKNCLSLISAREELYSAVFHLVTAASGAEEFYTLENNRARYEKTFEEARETDAATLQAWLGHPRLRIIDNSTDFEGKCRRLLQEIRRALGVPIPLGTEKRLLVKIPDMPQLGIPFQEISVEEAYLVSENQKLEHRVTRREQNNAHIFCKTNKETTKNGIHAGHERPVRITQYLSAFERQRDYSFDLVRKKRYCFAYKNQYFELDEFLEPERLRGLFVIKIELTQEQQDVHLPPSLAILEDITGNEKYTNKELARRK